MVREIGLTIQRPLSLAGGVEDAGLVESCRRGNPSGYETLYRVHGGRMKSIAFHLLGNTSDAEDAVQEAFLKVYRGIQGFSGNASLSTWIFRILINTCRDIGRRRRRDPQQTGTQELPLTWAPNIPLRLALEKALGQLQDNHRLVFLLFEVEGLRHSEIASILEVPEGTSKAWLFEAKKGLKRLLGEVTP